MEKHFVTKNWKLFLALFWHGKMSICAKVNQILMNYAMNMTMILAILLENHEVSYIGHFCQGFLKRCRNPCL
jgi:hypothetical protein